METLSNSSWNLVPLEPGTDSMSLNFKNDYTGSGILPGGDTVSFIWGETPNGSTLPSMVWIQVPKAFEAGLPQFFGGWYSGTEMRIAYVTAAQANAPAGQLTWYNGTEASS